MKNRYAEESISFQSTPEERMEWKEQREKRGADFFEHYFIASVIYAALYVLCIYKNTSGILVPAWVLVTIGYCFYIMKEMEIARKKAALPYCAGMLLLGLSTVFTGNGVIIFLNYTGFFILLISMLLYHFYDDSKWDFAKRASSLAYTVFGSLEMIDRPFGDGASYIRLQNKERDVSRKWKNVQGVFIGAACAVPVLFVLGCCLASADAIFQNALLGVFRGMMSPENLFGMGALFVFALMSSYCGIRFLAAGKIKEEVTPCKKRDPVTAITFLGILMVMYLFFSAIQVYYLFLAHGELPDGLTYAGYARTGFFQLLFVCMVNVVMILAIKKYFRQTRALDGLLLLCSLCTYIMIASSAYRMVLYIGAYHLTFLRISVLVSLLVLALLLLGADLCILRPAFPYFRYSMVVVSVIYLAFSFSHVDYFIAKYNLSCEKMTKEYDISYLSGLSTDAAPAIMEYVNAQAEVNPSVSEELRAAAAGELDQVDLLEIEEPAVVLYCQYMDENYATLREKGIRKFNVSRQLAKDVLKGNFTTENERY